LGLQFKAGGKQEAWAGAWSVITRNESAYIARWVKEVDTICTYNLEQSTIAGFSPDGILWHKSASLHH